MNNNNRDLLEQFFHMEWLFRRFQMQQHRGRGPMGAPYQGQGRILSLLKLKPEISQKELSKILDIRSQSLGELLAKLERQGYITRTPSVADRRGMDISLTEAGKTAAEEDNEPLSLDTLFECLSAEEQTTLGDYLARLIQRLEQQLEGSEAQAGIPGRPDFGDRGIRNPFRRNERGSPPDFRGLGRFMDRDPRRNPFGDQEPDTDPKKEE